MAESSNRQKEIFLKALDLPPAERAGFLSQACGADDALRRQIEAMLEAHAAPDSFLERPAAAMGATVDADTAPPLVTVLPDAFLGTRIGPYKLREQIGEGGMGVVYVAEQQEPVRRMVAFKVIKPGMDSAQVLARFEAERQALALMDHPNIAKVLDAGTTAEGRPYFVMELVKGVPITQYCDERRLSLRQRLELFIPVCQAVQHAHQKAIIHRDLKPSNVLIALYDGKPVPKVIDFGVAKAMGEQLTEKSIYTGFGAVVGTLAYMSPEQAELNQIDIDTRSDIYSLGVMLYELLTGSTPIDRQRLKEGAILEVLRLIREEEPPRPSTRISTANTLVTLSEQRQTEPAKLAILLRGDIDWIVMKALDKDRARRYETAVELGQDIERFLKDEPVEASPPSAAYRLRKFVKRNRGAVMAASLVLFALLSGIGGTTAGLFEARWQRDQAEEASGKLSVQTTRAIDAEKKVREQLDQVLDTKARLAAALEMEKDARLLADKNAKEARFEALRFNTLRHGIQMDLVYQFWKQGDFTQAAKTLEEAPEVFHQTWEYRYVRALCRRQAVPLDYIGVSTYGIFSPDGRTVATIDHRPRESVGAKLWDFGSNQQKGTLKHPSGIRTLAFSPDSKRIAGVCEGKFVKIWDVESAQEQVVVTKPAEFPSEVALNLTYSPDGKFLAVAWLEGVVLADAITGKAKHLLPARGQVVAFSPDSTRLAVGGGEAGLKVYEVETGKEKLAPASNVKPSDIVMVVNFSRDGKQILLGLTGYLLVWDAATGKQLHKIEHGVIFRADMGFTADGKNVVVVAGTIAKLFDLESGKEKALTGPVGSTTCESLNPEGSHVAWGTFAYGIGKSSPEKWAFPFPRHSAEVRSNRFSSDGKRIYQAEYDVFRILDAKTGAPTSSAKLSLLNPNGSGPRWNPWAITPDGKSLAVYLLNDPLRDTQKIVDVETGQERGNLSLPNRWGTTSTMSADGSLIAIGGSDGVFKVWNTLTGNEDLSASTKEGKVTGLAFRSDNAGLAVGTVDGIVQVWNIKAGKPTMTLKSPRTVRNLLFFPDGKRLFTENTSQAIIWDLASGQKIVEFPYDRDAGRVMLSPDGTRLFAFHKVWDTATGQVVFNLPYEAIALSPDGRQLLTAQPTLAFQVLEAP